MILKCGVPKPFICLLRGVNVGGKQMLRMDLLRSICTSLGYRDAQTILQSGNVVFRAANADARKIEAALKAQAGLEVSVFLRTPEELRNVIAANPFPEVAQRNPSHLIVMFLEGRPSTDAQNALRAAYAGPEPMHFAGRELYVHYGEGMGRSKLTNALIEKKLGMRGTARNWNTVAKLLDAAERLPLH